MSPRKGETRKEYNTRRQACRKTPQEREKASAQARKWRLANPDKVKANNLAHYWKSRASRSKLKYAYGVSLAQYDAMVVAQGGVCAACGGPPRKGRPLCVDHCHKTKLVRGLLCDACNICAGHVESPRRIGVELYLARSVRPGWASLGDQTDKFEVAA